MKYTRPRLGRILVDRAVITESHLDAALEYQRRESLRLGEALVALGLCGEEQVAGALAEQAGLPCIDLERTPPSREALLRIPPGTARKLGAVPVQIQNGRLLVAAREPLDFRIDEEFMQASGVPVTVVFGVPGQIDRVLERYEALLQEDAGRADAESPASMPAGALRIAEVSPQERINLVIHESLRQGAESIHLDVRPTGLEVSAASEGREERLASLPAHRVRIVVVPHSPGRGGDPQARGCSVFLHFESS